jgi:CheY-like chemotaxis protein
LIDTDRNSNSIVSIAGSDLARLRSGLVRRGLKELSAQTNELKRPRVVVVSTEEAINEGYSEMLNRNGCTAINTDEERLAGWPLEATIERIKRFRPDFVFLFRVWPQMTGSRVAHALFEHLPNVRFIVGTMDSDVLLNED